MHINVYELPEGESKEPIKPLYVNTNKDPTKKIHNDILFNLVTEYIGVAENEIAASMTHCLMKTRTLTEGGGVMGLTALLYKRLKLRPNEKVAVVLCGGNLDLQRLSVISRFVLKALGQCVTVNVDVPDVPG